MIMVEHSTKEKIVQAMYHLVAENGYDKTSISSIAKVVGISKATVYFHFESKEQILVELMHYIDETSDPSLANGVLASRSAKEFKERLIEFGHTVIGSYRNDVERRMVIAEIALGMARNPTLEQYQAQDIVSTLSLYGKIAEHGQKLGAIPATAESKNIAQRIQVLMLGLSQAILYNEPIDALSVWDSSVEQMLSV
ncbi:TetR/AcrR family transcriptional regulator [Eggerthella sp. YY7918]|uniref:TetR/AcrR family transcriptional regulator n=1 Tax=Eggerthella sp. (strain YY7918) TaxID=502558 RepID=UPI00021710A8|nr:TetR/AcrR family transcriptional regulator [Eggerthella sp. YY7918]BAK43469.1 transcriptional regulator [Eggerthella sp. YY7918]